MPYVQREPIRNSIIGAYEQRQSFATEYVASDSSEYTTFLASLAPAQSLDARLASIESSLNDVIRRLNDLETP